MDVQETPISRLIELVSFDQRYLALKNELAKLQVSLDADNNELQLCQAALYRADEQLKTGKQEVDQQELAMKILDESLKEKRKKLDGVSNPREYQALTKEIERIKQEQEQMEEALVEVWRKLDHAQEEKKAKQELCTKKIAELDVVIKEKMQAIESKLQEIKNCEEERAQKVTTIAQELLSKYETMYHQVPNPIVPVKNGNCSACFYNVIQQDLADLRRGKLLQCKDCFRLLYHE